MHGPPITIACECGEMKHVPYGERWTCDQCHRTWNTAQIPADEYWGIMREQRRYRLSAIGVALGIGALFGLLALFVSGNLILLLPLFLAGWFIWYMPRWRRKVRARARDLPKWELHPE